MVTALYAQICNAQFVSRPNILLLMAEDMSSRIGAFGDSVAVTPHLDALASQGVRYSNTFTTAGVCAPSRAAHILGQHQIATGTQHMRSSSFPAGGYYSVPPADAKAYPELLRAAGYYTYTDNKLDYQFSATLANSGPVTIWDKEGALAGDWKHRASGQPFFGFINFMATHESGIFRPLGEPPVSATHLVMQLLRWWQLDDPVSIMVQPEDIIVPPYFPDTATVRRDMARHYNNIAYMDREVGAILRQLEAAGLADSTIVIWTTDHGDGLPRAKRELYDSGIKVPMIIRWPPAFRPQGVKPGAVDARLISFVDIGPTVLTLAGVPVPAQMHGRSFIGNDTFARQYVYAARDRVDTVVDRQRAVRDVRYKYLRSWRPQQAGGHALAFRDNIDMVREMHTLYAAGALNAVQSLWYAAPGEERLYDLRQDPDETHDVSADPGYQSVLLRMRDAMRLWLERVGDWSEQPEDAMAERFTQNGARGITPAPVLSVSNNTLIIAPASPQHSIEYRIDGGIWQLYAGPRSVEKGAEIDARAVRYGWEESHIVSYR